jgi:hypothetical protein
MRTPAAVNRLTTLDQFYNPSTWVLDRAGSFVVEALERDRSVYRLYHQALADHLRRERDPFPTQRRITEALIQTVPGLADSANTASLPTQSTAFCLKVRATASTARHCDSLSQSG